MLDPSILDAIDKEALSAHAKHGANSMIYALPDRAYAILAEEVGEVAHELNEAIVHNRPIDLEATKKELIQVGAMAATMIAAIQSGYWS